MAEASTNKKSCKTCHWCKANMFTRIFGIPVCNCADVTVPACAKTRSGQIPCEKARAYSCTFGKFYRKK